MAGENSAQRPTTAGAVSGVREAARVPIRPLARLGGVRVRICPRIAATEAGESWTAIRRRAESIRSESVAVAEDTASIKRCAMIGIWPATRSFRPHCVASWTRATFPASGAFVIAAWNRATVSGVKAGTRWAGHPAVIPSRIALATAGGAPAAARVNFKAFASWAA